jgi:hypothetical protein
VNFTLLVVDFAIQIQVSVYVRCNNSREARIDYGQAGGILKASGLEVLDETANSSIIIGNRESDIFVENGYGDVMKIVVHSAESADVSLR